MSDKQLIQAANIIATDGVIILPTDTLYGLAANIFSPTGVKRIFDIKGRNPDMALPVLVSGWDQCIPLIKGDLDLGFNLQKTFWPGALTMIFKKSDCVPDTITAGRDTVAVRMPDHPAPLYICESNNTPITGTSANLSGESDALSLSDISADVRSKVDDILETNTTPQGTASTIIDLSGPKPVILRQGALNLDQALQEL